LLLFFLQIYIIMKRITLLVEQQQMGKLNYFPIVFDLCSDEMFEAVFLLADFRKSIK
jgi:hypothetical protein